MKTDLLTKLRALDKSLAATVNDFDGNDTALSFSRECAAFDLAELLPAIIAKLEADEKKATDASWISNPERMGR